MDQELEQRAAIVRGYESQFAHDLAITVINKPKLTVWMFLVPILFIYHANQIKRFKQNLANFQHGFTKTKLHALEQCKEELLQGKRKEEQALDLFADYEHDGPNIQELRRKQLEEIQLLMGHYRSLLTRSGQDYSSLVRSAYKSRHNFQTFLRRLGEAEIAVNKAALRAFHNDDESRRVVSEIEKNSALLRQEEARKIFNS